MTGWTFCKSLSQLRKVAGIKCKNRNGAHRDPVVLSDCNATASWEFSELSPDQLAHIQPAVQRAVQAMAHILRKSLPDKEKAKYPFIIHFIDPILRICSREGISVSLNRPDMAARPSIRPPNSPPAAAPTALGRVAQPGAQAGSEGHQVQTSQQQMQQSAAGLSHVEGSAGSGHHDHNSSASIKMAFEHDFKAGGSQGPIEFVFENEKGSIQFVIEVKWKLDTQFKEAIAQIAHQLIGAALHNASLGEATTDASAGSLTDDKVLNPVHGMLTDGLKWVAFRFTPTVLPKGRSKRGVEGVLEYSRVLTIMHESGMRGMKVEMDDLPVLLYQLIQLMYPGGADKLDNLDIAGSLDKYDNQLHIRTARLMSGEGLLPEDDNKLLEPHESRPSKRLRLDHGDSTTAQQLLDIACEKVTRLSLEIRKSKANDAYEAVVSAITPILAAAQKRCKAPGSCVEALGKYTATIYNVLQQLYAAVGVVEQTIDRAALALEAQNALAALAGPEVQHTTDV